MDLCQHENIFINGVNEGIKIELIVKIEFSWFLHHAMTDSFSMLNHLPTKYFYGDDPVITCIFVVNIS